MDCCTYDWRCIDKRCVCFCCRSEKNAFSVEVRITSDAVALLGMLSVRNAEKQETSPGFVSRSLLARRVRTSRLHFCLSITSLPLSEPQLAYNLLLLTLKCKDCQPVLCRTLWHRTAALTCKKKWVRIQRPKLKHRLRVNSFFCKGTWGRKL